MFLTQSDAEAKDLKEKIFGAFREAVFLSDLAERAGVDIVEAWKVVLELEKEGRVSYFSWQRRTAIVKKR
ncbi:MAG: hypothetical protein N2509_08850 [Treponemataceae bacterium]|nr:hypothetical protein [Treponemataceae bacterium]